MNTRAQQRMGEAWFSHLMCVSRDSRVGKRGKEEHVNVRTRITKHMIVGTKNVLGYKSVPLDSRVWERAFSNTWKIGRENKNTWKVGHVFKHVKVGTRRRNESPNTWIPQHITKQVKGGAWKANMWKLGHDFITRESWGTDYKHVKVGTRNQNTWKLGRGIKTRETWGFGAEHVNSGTNSLQSLPVKRRVPPYE